MNIDPSSRSPRISGIKFDTFQFIFMEKAHITKQHKIQLKIQGNSGEVRVMVLQNSENNAEITVSGLNCFDVVKFKDHCTFAKLNFSRSLNGTCSIQFDKLNWCVNIPILLVSQFEDEKDATKKRKYNSK